MAGKQFGADGFDCLAGPGDLVGAQIVHDHDITPYQRGNQNLLDIGEEQLAIDRSVEHTGATRPSWRRPAMKVEVFQCPCGTASTSR